MGIDTNPESAPDFGSREIKGESHGPFSWWRLYLYTHLAVVFCCGVFQFLIHHPTVGNYPLLWGPFWIVTLISPGLLFVCPIVGVMVISLSLRRGVSYFLFGSADLIVSLAHALCLLRSVN
jgi:hypothetical protein